MAVCGSIVEMHERTLTLLLEGELALLIVILVLSTTTVLASLWNIVSMMRSTGQQNKRASRAVSEAGLGFTYLSLVLRHID